MKVSVVDKHEFALAQDQVELSTDVANKISRGFSRLDAEFVDPDLLSLEEALKKQPGKKLGALAVPLHDTRGARGKASTEVQNADNQAGCKPVEESVSYIDIDAVDTEDGMVFYEAIRREALPSRAKHQVAPGDILVSKVRPNRGAVTLLSRLSEGALASSGFTLVRVASPSDLRESPGTHEMPIAVEKPGDENGITKEFIFAFLKTKFGRDQLIRRNRGSMYPAVLSDDVFDVWIPQPSEDIESVVRSRVERGLELWCEFYDLHSRAQKMLTEYLAPYGLPPDPLSGDRTAVDWTEVQSGDFFGSNGAQRFDAEFFRQGYREFEKRCLTIGDSFSLGEYFDLFPGSALAEGQGTTPYVKQAVLTNVGVNWTALSEEQGSLGATAATVKSGDILLACTAHEVAYVGRKVDLVRDIPESVRGPVGCVPDVMIVRSKEEKPEGLYGSYVAAFLRHPAGLFQAQRCIRGLRGGHVYRDDLARFVRVPLPPDDWLEGFEACSLKAEQARNEAKDQMKSSFRQTEEFVRSLIVPTQ